MAHNTYVLSKISSLEKNLNLCNLNFEYESSADKENACFEALSYRKEGVTKQVDSREIL